MLAYIIIIRLAVAICGWFNYAVINFELDKDKNSLLKSKRLWLCEVK